MSKIQVIDKAAKILNQFSELQPFQSTDQISAKLHLPRSTVYRILESLRENHFIESTEIPGRYRLGYQILHLSAGLQKSYDIGTLAKPYMEQLKHQFNETIQLQVLAENKYGIYLLVEECEDPLRVIFPLGNPMPLYAGCTVQSMLAFLPANLQEAAIPDNLTAFGPNSITSKKELYKKLELIRHNGWASSEEEVNPGIKGYSVPLFSASGRVLASLSIAGPSERIRPKEKEIIASLLDSSKQLSSQII